MKLAFDNNWIGGAGQVAIGLLAGIAVVIWSERFRAHGYRVFSFSLKAVGIGVLYLSIWAAFQVYSLAPAGIAFASMLTVTAATAAMAITQDAEILAAFALVGGFLTPVLLSTGQNHELALFSYLLLLDIASLVLVAVKPWRRLLILSYLGTLLLYLAWYFPFYTRDELVLTLGFATAFFAVFAIAPLISHRPGDTQTSRAIPLAVAFANAGIFFIEVYEMFEPVDKSDIAWFALALAAVYILLSWLAQRRSPDPALASGLRFLHLALAIVFITIAIPLALNGHWITIGWFVESAALVCVAHRIESDFVNAFALGALSLGVARLLFFDDFYSARLILNARMATYTVAVAALGWVGWYASKRKDKDDDEAGRKIAGGAVVALNLLALVALSREVADYYAQQMGAFRPARLGIYASTSMHSLQIARDFTYSALWMTYGAMLMVIGFWRRSAFVRWQALILIAVTTMKVFIYDLSELERGYRILSFIALGVLLLAISFVYQCDWLHLSSQKRGTERARG